MGASPRLDWVFVARCTACVAVVVAAGLAATLHRAPSALRISSIDDSDAAPLDFADARTRSAFREHRRTLQPDDLPSLLDTCLGDEAYRAEWTPSLEGEFRIVDVRVAGRQIEVVDYRFGHTPGSDDFGWRPTYRATLDEQRVEPVRARLTAVLRARPAAAVDDQIVDAERVHVEACRRGRYHYFDRAASYGDDAAMIADFARSIFALADRREARAGSTKQP